MLWIIQRHEFGWYHQVGESSQSLNCTCGPRLNGLDVFIIRSSCDVVNKTIALYLYGGLGSALTILSLSSFANLFFKSESLFNVQLYGGLAMFMGYVMADSQLIIERADRGDEDYVSHAWLLFTDLSGIFTRMLIVLLKQSEEEERKKRASRKGRRDVDE